jgi:hypothetical protein
MEKPESEPRMRGPRVELTPTVPAPPPDSAEDYFKRAKKYLEKREYDKTIEECDKGLRVYPNNPELKLLIQTAEGMKKTVNVPN